MSGVRWSEIAVLATALAALLPTTAVLAGRLRALQLGDDAAVALGLRIEHARLGILVCAVALTAVATAAVGPVAFVALMSAPIARRLVATGGLALVPTALVGIVIVVAADLVALHLLPGDIQVPVGVVTGAIGGPYLLWTLALKNRAGS